MRRSKINKITVGFLCIFLNLTVTILTAGPDDEEQNSINKKKYSEEYKKYLLTDNSKPSKENQGPPRVLIKSEPGRYSKIEKMFNHRFKGELNNYLKQYGYNFFYNKLIHKYLPVSDQYNVGPGDSINLYIWGAPVDISRMKGFYSLKIDRDGKIYIPKLGVFYVWGLSVPKIKDVISRNLHKKYRGFEIDITLGKLREYPVYVSGFVKNPGIVMVTGVNTIIDVLSKSGGVEKNGSLRNIVIKRVRNNKIQIINIDLYKLLINGEPVPFRIYEGDSVFVKPLGVVAGITGGIKRSSIYELGASHKSIKDLIALSGGVIPSAHLATVKLYRYDGKNINIITGDLNNDTFMSSILKDGDFLVVDVLYNLVKNGVLVKGHVAYPGNYAHKKGMQLSDLLKQVGLLPDSNLHSAAIRRDLAEKSLTFSPEDILTGKSDIEIKEHDIIIFYPRSMYEPIQVMGEVNNPMIITYYENITLIEALQDITYKTSAKQLKAEIYWERDKSFDNLPDYLKKKISKTSFLSKQNGPDDDKKDKINLYKKNFITIYLKDLLYQATENANLLLPPGTQILIKKNKSYENNESVTILGEVTNPGSYSISGNKDLYSIIKRAGGYSKEAYPEGLIFIRSSAQKLQRQQIQLSFLSMQEYMSQQSEGLSYAGSSPEERAMMQMTVSRYKHTLELLQKRSKLAIGRIALEVPAKIAQLKKHNDNIKLVDGDFVYIPKKQNYVLVLGDVYNQISLPYAADMTVKYYLNQLGGLAKNADEDNIYIIRANGKIISKKQFSSIKKLYFSVDWNRKRINFARDFENMRLKQGDTIVVPTKLKVPVMWRPLLKDIAQIMFQSIATVVLATSL